MKRQLKSNRMTEENTKMFGKNLSGAIALTLAVALALSAGCTEQKKDETKNGEPPATQGNQQGMSGMSGNAPTDDENTSP